MAPARIAVGRRREARFHLNVVYQHLVAMLGALGLAAFLSDFIIFAWHGMFRDLFGLWDSVVLPAMRLLAGITVVPLGAKLFDWHPHVPLLVQDYICAGIVLLPSNLHAERRIHLFSQLQNAVNSMRSGVLELSILLPLTIVTVVVVLSALALLWPFVMAGELIFLTPLAPKSGIDAGSRGSRTPVPSWEKNWARWGDSIAALLPVLYLIVALVINHLLTI